MAKYSNWRLTKFGRNLMQSTINNHQSVIEITHLAIGDTYDPNYNYDEANTIANTRNTYNVLEYSTIKNNENEPIMKLHFMITNMMNNSSIVGEDYKINEIGLYAKNKVDGTIKLFAYSIVTDGDGQPMVKFDNNDSSTVISISYSVYIGVSNDTKIDVYYDMDNVYLTPASADRRYVSLAQLRSINDSLANLSKDTISGESSLATQLKNLVAEFKQHKESNVNEFLGVNTSLASTTNTTNTNSRRIDEHLSNYNTKIQELTDADTTINASLDRKTDKDHVYPLYHRGNVKEHTNLTSEHMMYIFRTIKSMQALLKKTVTRDEFRILSKASFNQLMGYTVPNRNIKLSILKNESEEESINNFILGKSDSKRTLLEKITSKNVNPNLNGATTVTIDFYSNISGDPTTKLNASVIYNYVKQNDDVNLNESVYRVLYRNLTKPINNSAPLISRVQLVKINLSNPVDNFRGNNYLNNIHNPLFAEDYLELPPYGDVSSSENYTIYGYSLVDEKASYVLTHYIARFNRYITNIKSNLSNAYKDRMRTKMNTIQEEDKIALYTLTNSVHFWEYILATASNILRKSTNKTEALDNLLDEFYLYLLRNVYNKGYKIPSRTSLENSTLKEQLNQALTLVTYNNIHYYSWDVPALVTLGMSIDTTSKAYNNISIETLYNANVIHTTELNNLTNKPFLSTLNTIFTDTNLYKMRTDKEENDIIEDVIDSSVVEREV